MFVQLLTTAQVNAKESSKLELKQETRKNCVAARWNSAKRGGRKRLSRIKLKKESEK
jgi:hypothetical protein